jgi:hypothetical protein
MPPDPLTLAAAEQAHAVAIQMMAERGLEHLLKAVMAPACLASSALAGGPQAFVYWPSVLKCVDGS